MPKLRFEEIERALTAGKMAPVYLIHGPERYIVRLITEKIIDVYSAETGAEVERHSARGIDAVKVVDDLKTVPMWTKGRLVIVGGADKLSAGARELFGDYAGSPSDSSILVLTAEKFDGRSKLYKTVSKNGIVVEAKNIYPNQVPFWINRECRAKGRSISQEAARFMVELIGTDLSQMAEAVEKVILYIGEKKMIELSDVETVISDTSQRSIFDLTNAVGSRDLARAENRLENLLRNNENPVVVVNMLARHWRLLLTARELRERGVISERDVARELKVHPFFVREYISQSRGFTRDELVKGIKALWRSDVEVKSSRLPRSMVLHNLIVELTR